MGATAATAANPEGTDELHDAESGFAWTMEFSQSTVTFRLVRGDSLPANASAAARLSTSDEPAATTQWSSPTNGRSPDLKKKPRLLLLRMDKRKSLVIYT